MFRLIIVYIVSEMHNTLYYAFLIVYIYMYELRSYQTSNYTHAVLLWFINNNIIKRFFSHWFNDGPQF